MAELQVDERTAALAAEAEQRPMRKDAARNRALLIEAGRDVFARRGLEGSLDEIAKQAGVGVGTAYRHFANKHDLAAAIMQEGIEKVRDLALEQVKADDPWVGLVTFVEGVLSLQAEDRGLREAMLGLGQNPKSDDAHEVVVGPASAVFERAQAAGVVRADAAPTDMAFMIMMLCTASDVAAEMTPGMWRRYLPTLLAGLRPDGPELPLQPLTEAELRITSCAHYDKMTRGRQAEATLSD